MGKEKLVYSATDFEALTLPDIGYWMQDMIPKKGIVLLHGKYGAYKTAIVLNMARAISIGQTLWGQATEKTKVLFMECDTPIQALQPRARSLGFSGTTVDFAPIYPGFDIVNPKRDEWNHARHTAIHDIHLREKYGLVIVDSLRTIHSMSEKEGETAKEVYLSLARMFPDATVLLVHHDRKTHREDGHASKYKSQEQTEVDNESFMGSQRWIDLATTALKISKHGNQGIVLSQSKSQWGVQAKPIFLHPDATDGTTLTVPALLDDNAIAAAVATLMKKHTIKNLGHLDSLLAKHFGVSARYVRDFRVAYEERNGQVPTRSRA